MKLRSWPLTAALAVTALLLPAQAASAKTDPPSCPKGSVCFWSEEGFHGDRWEWQASIDYRDMPTNLHDHVGSFVASTRACFTNWDTWEKHEVNVGDSRSDYLGDFGARIDGVGPNGC
ncbi:peptidase inhibitor family I36 protein [Streptomyces sp. NPDC046805]|uniref:peptidase inhibitor family I36 protein n=1 Tax=Streptomyces sp. NPDC046805 TaxID=3155134 RepID=UPI0033FCCB6A